MQPLLLLVLWSGCGGGDPVGTPCALDKPGALGFGFDDPCDAKCLALWDITCPDGSSVRPGVCSGEEGCTPGGCGDGQVCYAFDDPFETRVYCVPDDVCGPLTPEEAATWERSSRARMEAKHAEYQERLARRMQGGATQLAAPVAPPAEDVAPPEAPAVEAPDPAPAAEPTPHLLVEAWSPDLAVVGCLTAGGLRTGADCVGLLPAGTEVVHGGWRARTTGPKDLRCPAMDGTTPGIGLEPIASAAGGDRWGWVPSPPPGWVATAPAPLDPVLVAVVNKEAPATREASLTLAVQADLDGDPFEERVVRAHHAVDDADKPGHTTLYLIDDGAVVPLDLSGLEANGVQDVKGYVPLETGGALLVFTSTWMGGSGVHAVAPRDGTLAPWAEVACGS